MNQSGKSFRCHFCRKALTDPRSIALGVGPECAAKQARAYVSAGTTETEMARIAEFDENEARMIQRAMACGRPQDIAWATRRIAKVRQWMTEPARVAA